MSIVAMKRNTYAKRNLSGKGRDGFSLVGGYRNIGAVGPTNLAQSVTRTPFRGNLPMGSGGCCGNYTVVISNSGSCCTNDPEIIKSTVKNTSGMIDNKYRWTKRGYPNFWTQDTSPEAFSQSSHISKLKEQAAGRCGVVTSTDAGTAPACSSKTSSGASSCIKWVGGIPQYRTLLAKDPKAAMSSGEYMSSGLLKSKCLPSPASLQPFPFTQARNGCLTNYNTWQEAQAAGQLPSNYVG